MISLLTNPFYAHVKTPRDIARANTLSLDLWVAKPIFAVVVYFWLSTKDGGRSCSSNWHGDLSELVISRIPVRASIGVHFNTVCMSDSIYTGER
jgi:hypothetical protein